MWRYCRLWRGEVGLSSICGNSAEKHNNNSSNSKGVLPPFHDACDVNVFHSRQDIEDERRRFAADAERIGRPLTAGHHPSRRYTWEELARHTRADWDQAWHAWIAEHWGSDDQQTHMHAARANFSAGKYFPAVPARRVLPGKVIESIHTQCCRFEEQVTLDSDRLMAKVIRECPFWIGMTSDSSLLPASLTDSNEVKRRKPWVATFPGVVAVRQEDAAKTTTTTRDNKISSPCCLSQDDLVTSSLRVGESPCSPQPKQGDGSAAAAVACPSVQSAAPLPLLYVNLHALSEDQRTEFFNSFSFKCYTRNSKNKKQGDESSPFHRQVKVHHALFNDNAFVYCHHRMLNDRLTQRHSPRYTSMTWVPLHEIFAFKQTITANLAAHPDDVPALDHALERLNGLTDDDASRGRDVIASLRRCLTTALSNQSDRLMMMGETLSCFVVPADPSSFEQQQSQQRTQYHSSSYNSYKNNKRSGPSGSSPPSWASSQDSHSCGGMEHYLPLAYFL